MITVGITKDFLDTLFVESDKDENHKDLFLFIQNEIFGIRLICDFASIEELTSAIAENPVWELLMDKYDFLNFNRNLNNDLTIDEFYVDLNEQNVFLTSHSVDVCAQLSKERGYIYISVEDISISWSPIKYIRENGLLKVTNEVNFPNGSKFESWDKIDKYCIPSTSIVIFDKYILKDSGNQMMNDNLLKLLEKLCKNSLRKPLKLSIISEFETDKQIYDAYSKIEKYLKEKNILNVNLNIIKHDKSKYPSNFEGLHYRVILTNNIRIKCDDSFNFFKKNGKINNDADINLSLHLCRIRKSFYEKEINHIKQYVSKLKNLPPEINLRNKIYYHPDKINYLFS